jgi:hypothetical protein
MKDPQGCHSALWSLLVCIKCRLGTFQSLLVCVYPAEAVGVGGEAEVAGAAAGVVSANPLVVVALAVVLLPWLPATSGPLLEGSPTRRLSLGQVCTYGTCVRYHRGRYLGYVGYLGQVGLDAVLVAAPLLAHVQDAAHC